MENRDFNFLDYAASLEDLLFSYYKFSSVGLKHSSNLGEVREHFVDKILRKMLPETVAIGRGEITDGKKAQNNKIL